MLVTGSQQITCFVIAERCKRWGMNVTSCDLTDLHESLSRTNKAGGSFNVVIGDAGSATLLEAFAGFRDAAGAASSVNGDNALLRGSASSATDERNIAWLPRFPKLVLITPDPVESLTPLRPDAALPAPPRAKVLKKALCDLLLTSETELPPATGFVSSTPLVSLAGAPLKVLVTDDNLINLKLASALLTKLGCDVVTAEDGAEALRKVSGTDYALVFMDCVMPGMDGFAATAAIRNLAGKCSQVPIVALTASATAEDRARCLAVGMDDFLTKPIRAEQLARCLSRWARR